MTNKRGIIIFAAGHPNYGKMAFNLAVSIKWVEPQISIALVRAGNATDHLSVKDLGFAFDHIIEAPVESYTHEGRTAYIKSKIFMYDLSPYDETIYLDADILWLPKHKPSELFEQFAGIEFTIQNSSKHIEWATIGDVREKYELANEKYVPVSSEFVYFKKSERMRLFFDRIKENYSNLKVKLTGLARNGFAGAIPDELPTTIAMMQLGVYPHEIPYSPIYWQTKEKKIPTTEELYEKYYAISTGGKVIGLWTKKIYDRLVARYFNDANLRYIWKLQNKRSFLPERSII